MDQRGEQRSLDTARRLLHSLAQSMRDLKSIKQQLDGSALVGEQAPISANGQTAVVFVQRIENALIALAILVVFITLGLPWWILFAVFMLFDLSAVGYLRNRTTGALFYNIVHNYSVPVILILLYAVLRANNISVDWLVLVAASWAFHVAVDRALGYGLKMRSFQHTHLGMIGKAKDGSDE